MSDNYLYPYSALVQGAANDDIEAALAGLLYSQSENRSVRVSPSSAILLMRHVMSLNEKFKKAEARIAESTQFKTAFDEWHSKTEWVQTDKRFDVLMPWGQHRADVMRKYIEHQDARIAELESYRTGWDLLKERAEKAEAEVAELKETISTKMTDAKLHNTQMAFEQGEEIKTLKAELAALRGAAVPVYQVRLLDGHPLETQWIEVTYQEFNTPLKNESEWGKRILWSHPAPPDVVLPSADHEADGGYKYYRHETILKTLCANGITVKSGEEGISVDYPDGGFSRADLYVKGLNSVGCDSLNDAASDQSIEHPDKARMDWLCAHAVQVRHPMVYGSRAMFWAQADSDDDDEEYHTTLREQVDAAIKSADGEGE